MPSVFDQVLGPQATSAPKPRASVFDDILGAQAQPAAAPAPEAPQPGIIESALRGGAQGVTMGFSDELTGAASALTGGDYAKARDEARAANAAAKKAHRIAYGASELIGGLAGMFIPGGAAVKGASLAARGAAAGAAAGLGHSEADLTKGDIEGAAKDTAVGGVLGGVVGGVAGKVLGGAEARVGRRTMSDIGNKADKSVRDVLADFNTGTNAVVNTAEKHGLTGAVARNPEKLTAATKAAKEAVGKVHEEVYSGVNIPRSQVMNEIFQKVEKPLQETNPDLAKVVSRKLEAMRSMWSSHGADDPHVPAEKIAEFAREFSKRGLADSGVEPTAAQEMQKDIWGAVKDVIRKNVEKVHGADAAVKLDAANKEYAILSNIGLAGAQRQQLTQFAPTGLRSFSARGALESAYEHTAGKVVRPVDAALAGLMKRARAGDAVAIQTTRAIQSGAPWSLSARPGDVPEIVIDTAATALAP